MDTDHEWERWGAEDPYFGVLTNPIFRLHALTTEAKEEFFRSGQTHVDEVLDMCRRWLDPSFAPQSVFDFGCGVGRLLVAFAQTSQQVVGVDVSVSMLAEARKNCTLYDVGNVLLLPSDDTLSAVEGTFDLVHSSIVLQHIEVERGRRLFELLVEKVRHGGVGALHVTFALDLHAQTFGQTPPADEGYLPAEPSALGLVKSQLRRALEPLGIRRHAPQVEVVPEANPDPEMQMNFYNLSELLFILQRAGCAEVHTRMTNHGGALGAFLVFRRP